MIGPGTATWGGDCVGLFPTEVSENTLNTVMPIGNLIDGPYDCTLQFTDENPDRPSSNTLGMRSFTIDTTAPTLTLGDAIDDLTTDNTPSYVFQSGEAGSITYSGSGDCGDGDVAEILEGEEDTDVTVTFGTVTPLENKLYSGCTITVTDEAGNVSDSLVIPDFTVDAPLNSDDFVITVQTDNSGDSEDYQFAIPTFSGQTYDYSVDCDDDGTLEVENHTSDVGYICDYGDGNEGEYTIRIIGTFPRIYFNGSNTDVEKILSVEQWGTGQWSSMNGAFGGGCINLVINALDTPDLSNVIDLGNMFLGATSFNEDIGNWDLSNVENMRWMFKDASLFNQDISNWNTSNVTDMSSMFSGATNFNKDISTNGNNWNVENVTDMNWMFKNASSFNQNIGNWNVGEVIDMSGMFGGAIQFNQDLSSWNIEKVTSMSDMFFDGAGLSIMNYDALLIGWNALTLQPDVTLNAGTSSYCSTEAVTAHDNMTDDVTGYNWYIVDGGNSCTQTDTKPPYLQLTVPVSPTLTNDNQPTYTFTSNEIGRIAYSAECTGDKADAVIGNNEVTFNTLSDGTYSNCTLTVTDASNNESLPLAINAFEVDATAPVLSGDIVTMLIENSPELVFESDSIGVVTYSGNCGNGTLTESAISTTNTTVFGPLQNDTYSDCKVMVTDEAGNVGEIEIQEFIIDAVDTIPPVRSAGKPENNLPVGTTSTTLELITNEPATCKYTRIAGTAYDDIDNANIFDSTTSSTVHSKAVTGLSAGDYNYHVKCKDSDGNANPAVDDFTIIFTILSSSAPTDISLSSAVVQEAQPINTAVGSLTTTDPDAGDTHVYSLSSGCSNSGVGNGSFNIDSDNLRTSEEFIFVNQSSYDICIKTDDGEGGTYEKEFTITISDPSQASCTFDGATVIHGETVLAWESDVVPHGDTCNYQDRTCNNGTLSGTFTFDSCTVSSETCDATHLNLCTTETTCSASGGFWCNNQCQATDCSTAPVCDVNHLNLCTTQTTCDTAGGFWCDNQCKDDSCSSDGIFDGDIEFKVGSDYIDLDDDSTNYIDKEKIKFKGEEKGLKGGKVELYVEGDLEETTTIGSDGKWKIKYKGKEGETEKYELKFYDKNGKYVDNEKFKIRIDTDDPEIEEIPHYLNKRAGDTIWWNNYDNHYLKKTEIRWDGDKHKFKIKDANKKETRRQEWRIPTDASKGLHHVRIKTYDKSGNKEMVYLVVNVW
ncbi:MAG: BspA family leucine-rich repeat surface protein [Bacteroidota bacterium]|nr:BspA family leucine-rich repeat surface protein [Bacteroidota bacterium]